MLLSFISIKIVTFQSCEQKDTSESEDMIDNDTASEDEDDEEEEEVIPKPKKR